MIASGGQPIAEPPTEPWHVLGSFLGSNSNERHTGKLEASGIRKKFTRLEPATEFSCPIRSA